MNRHPRFHRRVSGRCLCSLLALLLGLSLASRAPAQAATGGIVGTISNAATGRMLEGAVVSIATPQRTEVTDQTGRFALSGLPAGEYAVAVSYNYRLYRERPQRVYHYHSAISLGVKGRF